MANIEHKIDPKSIQNWSRLEEIFKIARGRAAMFSYYRNVAECGRATIFLIIGCGRAINFFWMRPRFLKLEIWRAIIFFRFGRTPKNWKSAGPRKQTERKYHQQ